MMIEKFKAQWNRLKTHKMFASRIENITLGVLLLGLVWTLFSHFLPDQTEAASQTDEAGETFAMDEYLPEGYVLLPLEFENQAALEPLISSFAIVNIYQTTGEDARRGKLVAKNVKIMRAPQNPQSFAALIPENQVANMMKGPGGYYGVIQRKNPDAHFQKASAAPPVRQVRIQQFEGVRP